MAGTTSVSGSANRFVYLIAGVCALGGLLFGYDIGVISGALLFIREDLALSPFLQSVVVSGLLVGAVVGALVGGPLSDRYGRRRTVMLAALIFVLGAIGAGLSPSVGALIAFRFVLGLGVGLASLIVPLYISEVSPANVRGGLVSLNQLMITIGILAAYLVNFALAESEAWRWMLGLAAIPAVILGVGMFFLPETPRWLVSKNLTERARSVLRRTRGEERVDEELADIERVESQEEEGLDELRAPWVRPALIVGVGLAIFQQITGINTIIYYAPTILEETGFGASASILATVGVGVVNVLLTVVAIWLVDRVGRRPLLLFGIIGMIVSLILLGLAFILPALSGVVGILATVCLMLYVASFAVSLGPVFWLLISEIYPLKIRGSAMSVATIANWASNFVVALTFLSLVQLLGQTATFWLYALVSIGAWFFVYFLVPETKGRSLEKIEDDLRNNVVTT